MPVGKHYDLDTDNTLSNNSDNVIASQKATKEYVDNNYVPQTMLIEAATVAFTGSYNDLTDKPTIPDPLPSQTGNSGKFLTTNGSTTSWATVSGGSGTVTSVRVQATSPVQSSTSTEQTTSLNTTISLADGYGDTKNPYASKTANTVLAAPNGSNGTPSFRALVKADIPLASEAAASGGTDTSLVTTGEKYTWNNKLDIDNLVEIPVIIESYKSGTSWYRIWSNGWVEQGGRTASGSPGFVTKTLLIEMADTDYCLLNCNNRDANVSDQRDAYIISTTQIGVGRDNSAGIWYVCGQKA